MYIKTTNLLFKSNLAKTIEVSIGASTCTLGSHMWKPKAGNLVSLINKTLKYIKLKTLKLKFCNKILSSEFKNINIKNGIVKIMLKIVK